MIMPGVQKPHWRPWCSQNAAWSGCSPSAEAIPSIVVTLGAIGLDGEHRARLHGLAVDVDGAGAALRGVAADVGPGQVQVLADQLDQEPSRLDVHLPGNSVDDERNVLVHGPTSFRHGHDDEAVEARAEPVAGGIIAARPSGWAAGIAGPGRASMMHLPAARNQPVVSGVASCAAGAAGVGT